ncbi:10926_t:CDS:2, partial [Racocetra fulgida]
MITITVPVSRQMKHSVRRQTDLNDNGNSPSTQYQGNVPVDGNRLVKEAP